MTREFQAHAAECGSSDQASPLSQLCKHANRNGERKAPPGQVTLSPDGVWSRLQAAIAIPVVRLRLRTRVCQSRPLSNCPSAAAGLTKLALGFVMGSPHRAGLVSRSVSRSATREVGEGGTPVLRRATSDSGQLMTGSGYAVLSMASV